LDANDAAVVSLYDTYDDQHDYDQHDNDQHDNDQHDNDQDDDDQDVNDHIMIVSTVRIVNTSYL